MRPASSPYVPSPYPVSPGLTRAKAPFATPSPHSGRALVSSAGIEGPAPCLRMRRAFASLPRLTEQGRDFLATLIVVPAAFATCVTALMILAELVKATSA